MSSVTPFMTVIPRWSMVFLQPLRTTLYLAVDAVVHETYSTLVIGAPFSIAMLAAVTPNA